MNSGDTRSPARTGDLEEPVGRHAATSGFDIRQKPAIGRWTSPADSCSYQSISDKLRTVPAVKSCGIWWSIWPTRCGRIA